jgi:hypothetical protein
LAAFEPLVDEPHQNPGWALSAELQHFGFDD